MQKSDGIRFRHMLDAAARATHPEIPWSDIIAMRNRLIHVYFDVDLDRLADTIATDLPPLIASVERLLGPESGTIS